MFWRSLLSPSSILHREEADSSDTVVRRPTQRTAMRHISKYNELHIHHVSDGPSVHHQESKTVHMLYVQSWTPDDGRKDRPKHVE
jgi:hypothetical protein